MKFMSWLQARLNHHGAALRIDGVFGPRTRVTLMDFQRAKGLTVSGIADRETVNALRKNRGDDTTDVATEPQQMLPPWAAEMARKSGLHEVRDNRALAEWLRIGKYLGDPKDLPWCGDAVETCIVKTLLNEPVPNNPFWAQAWKNFGSRVERPMVGAIGVIRWSSRAGHVGFVVDWSPSRVSLLGGNQSNKINIRSFPRNKFIAYRWPSTYPLASYPKIKGDAQLASLMQTR